MQSFTGWPEIKLTTTAVLGCILRWDIGRHLSITKELDSERARCPICPGGSVTLSSLVAAKWNNNNYNNNNNNMNNVQNGGTERWFSPGTPGWTLISPASLWPITGASGRKWMSEWIKRLLLTMTQHGSFCCISIPVRCLYGWSYQPYMVCLLAQMFFLSLVHVQWALQLTWTAAAQQTTWTFSSLQPSIWW